MSALDKTPHYQDLNPSEQQYPPSPVLWEGENKTAGLPSNRNKIENRHNKHPEEYQTRPHERHNAPQSDVPSAASGSGSKQSQ